MKKVLFYIENKWAFGSIHYGLCKELYKYNIHAQVLDWGMDYTPDEFKYIINTYDIIVTTPPFVLKLYNNFNVPLNKISAIGHAQWDILLAVKEANFDFYPYIHSFAVISNILFKKCKEWNFATLPKITEVGINFDFFYSKPSSSLKIVGYGGAKETYNFWGQTIKRGHLVEAATQKAELTLKPHNFYNFVSMPAYYKSVDCVVMSSIEEGGGLPMLEAAAAGRLCIGTPVGYFEENAPKGGGIIMPLEENKFVTKTSETLQYYKNNPVEYVKKCQHIQEYAKENYDWPKKIQSWLELLS